jgi:hypothetical protein
VWIVELDPRDIICVVGLSVGGVEGLEDISPGVAVIGRGEGVIPKFRSIMVMCSGDSVSGYKSVSPTNVCVSNLLTSLIESFLVELKSGRDVSQLASDPNGSKDAFWGAQIDVDVPHSRRRELGVSDEGHIDEDRLDGEGIKSREWTSWST